MGFDFIEMIDKAAANLATKGPELENHIREANKDGRFNFLNPNDPYYAYYRFKYQEVKDGKGKFYIKQIQKKSFNCIDIDASIVSQSSNQVQDHVQAVPDEPVQLAPKEPELFDFSAPMPAMSAQDL